MSVPGITVPPLGPTGEGEPVYPDGTGPGDYAPGERPIYWWDPAWPSHAVRYQLDRPACAFRCFYESGSSPCDRETADRYVAFVKENVPGRTAKAGG